MLEKLKRRDLLSRSLS
ncbi:hypothetical protein Goklo_024403 [Gossypium klotzschianum]|uniref:Uncharacterized protein n=1 Tax=Gossypium klotzschianum TaxID=34286 RepID=A0A7J8W7A8_9ROSI|nr:hypothetical protein [Gossypium klotzschianum]